MSLITLNEYSSLFIVIIGNDTGESVWWRGCTPLNDQKLGCTERKWNGTGKEILVDECICNEDLCNEDMQKISTEKPTTIPGIIYVCL